MKTKTEQHNEYLKMGGTMTINEWEKDGRYDPSLEYRDEAIQKFCDHFDKFRSGLFKASLDHYIETGKPSGSLLLEIEKMLRPDIELLTKMVEQFYEFEHGHKMSNPYFTLKQWVETQYEKGILVRGCGN